MILCNLGSSYYNVKPSRKGLEEEQSKEARNEDRIDNDSIVYPSTSYQHVQVQGNTDQSVGTDDQ